MYCDWRDESIKRRDESIKRRYESIKSDWRYESKDIKKEYTDEYALLKDLGHPNVTKILGHGYLKIDTLGNLEKSFTEIRKYEPAERPTNDFKVPFIAMEFAEEGTLGDVVQREMKNVDESAFHEMVTRRLRQIIEG